MTDGTPVTTERQWREQRRPELLRLFEENIYGKTPVGRPDHLRFVVREEKADAWDGRATQLRVGVLFEGRDDGRQMELLVALPNHVPGPAPLFLGLNFDGNLATVSEDSKRRLWPYAGILERGYGVATAWYQEIEPDEAGQWAVGPRGLGPPPTDGESWGALGAWAWALSRALDFLETDPRVDARRVAVCGFSRLGKAALWAGAQDERFAAVISQNSGKGGISLSQRPVGEPVANLAGPLGYWFAPNYARYSGHEAALPVDGHLLAALIAPRPLLILSASEDHWSDPEGEFLAGAAASPVYRLLGREGLAADRWPAPPAFVISTVGYGLRPGPHGVMLEDWRMTLDWADRYLQGNQPYY